MAHLKSDFQKLLLTLVFLTTCYLHHESADLVWRLYNVIQNLLGFFLGGWGGEDDHLFCLLKEIPYFIGLSHESNIFRVMLKHKLLIKLCFQCGTVPVEILVLYRAIPM